MGDYEKKSRYDSPRISVNDRHGDGIILNNIHGTIFDKRGNILFIGLVPFLA